MLPSYRYKKLSKRLETKHSTDSDFFDAPLEQFSSRIKQEVALCNWEALENSLVKSIFIQGMANPEIQMDLLSEDRDPLETLNNAITMERSREPATHKQHTITNSTTIRNQLHPTHTPTNTRKKHTTKITKQQNPRVLEKWIQFYKRAPR